MTDTASKSAAVTPRDTDDELVNAAIRTAIELAQNKCAAPSRRAELTDWSREQRARIAAAMANWIKSAMRHTMLREGSTKSVQISQAAPMLALSAPMTLTRDRWRLTLNESTR